MKRNAWTRNDICHWCGKAYKRPIGDRRHRFCSTVCKQAHYRAYKKYVTGKSAGCRQAAQRAVTRKKQKKKLSYHQPAHIEDK